MRRLHPSDCAALAAEFVAALDFFAALGAGGLIVATAIVICVAGRSRPTGYPRRRIAFWGGIIIPRQTTPKAGEQAAA